MYQNICVGMLIAALFLIVKKLETTQMPIYCRMENCGYVYAMKNIKQWKWMNFKCL